MCSKSFDIKTGGRSALKSHQGSATHDDIVKKRKKNSIGSYYESSNSSPSTKSSASPSSDASSSASSASSSSTLSSSGTSKLKSSSHIPGQSKLPYDVGKEALDAEIIWCLYMVDTHQSARSCDQLPEIFKHMFKNNPVVEMYRMKKDKCRYFIRYGIYPVFKGKLIDRIKLSQWFSVSFDESLNKEQQKCQMDVNIRYWNVVKNIAETAYFTSRMLLRPNAQNITDELFLSIKLLDRSKFLHLAMDGPSTNWAVLDLVDGILEDGGLTKTLNIGSCSLHILHGAFGTGIQSTSWKLGKLMKAMFKILDQSPARRDVYLKEGTSEKFPQSFSETRWIEDEPVADRALKTWSSIVALVRHFEGLSKSKRPQNNKSYDTLVEHHTDLLVPAKLHFFRFLATILQPYLIMFQTDNPMVPFMFDQLSGILYRLLSLVYIRSKVDSKRKLKELMSKEFLQLAENQMNEMQVDIGAAAKCALQEAAVSTEKKRKFRKECKGAIVSVLLKLHERLPTNKTVVVCASSLSPNNMLNQPDQAVKRFKSLADVLFSLKKITASVADNAKGQYECFIRSCVPKEKEKLDKFDFRNDRLDSFLHTLLSADKNYKDMWSICKLVFVLNHGQAFCERGFSINKLTSDDNMDSEFLIAQRLIYDTIKKSGNVTDIPITNELRNSCKSAHSQMENDKERKKKEKAESEKDLKRKAKYEEITKVKKAKQDAIASIDVLRASLTSAAIASGSSGNKARENAIKAAAFAKELQEKENTVGDLTEAEKKLQDEYKALGM